MLVIDYQSNNKEFHSFTKLYRFTKSYYCKNIFATNFIPSYKLKWEHKREVSSKAAYIFNYILNILTVLSKFIY